MNRTLMTRTALVLLTLIPVACSSPKERARQKLGEMNISYDQNTFIERAKAGDGIVVVLIFVIARIRGVDGNAIRPLMIGRRIR